jgi:hypothetical protein
MWGYRDELAGAPGQRATVDVALALIGGMPSPTSAGKVSSVPPPAMEFMTPPSSAATTTSRICVSDNGREEAV